MTNKTNIHNLQQLFELHFNEKVLQTQQLAPSGSERVYYRITGTSHSAIGVFNNNISENEAFFSFSFSLAKSEVAVPSIYTIAKDRKHYLLSDLGNTTLYDYLSEENHSPKALCQVKNAILNLLKIQTEGGKHIDFSKCYPREYFDRQSIMWDLNYFKYNFLKITHTAFDEQALENDFDILANELLKAPTGYFMYRDFQTRNIMLHTDKLWFIDYQGGRKGPLQYDLASILFSPKTGLNNIQRETLQDVYLNQLETLQKTDREQFTRIYYLFALARILQALGAYGFRGIIEGRLGFRRSIPTALQNLSYLFGHKIDTALFPEIRKCLKHLLQSSYAEQNINQSTKLTIRVVSFSFKKGYPYDSSENGGGFVFDCRGLPNPGRLEKYKSLNGTDESVIKYLEQYLEVKNFVQNVEKTVSPTIKNYIERGFKHLCVSFGCTGGQHRSVYNAEKFTQNIENKYPVNVVLIHTEKQNWKQDG